jgi:hypothetical protein
MRSVYCKFSTSKIEQHQSTNKSTIKNNFYTTTTQKRSKKAPLKKHYFKKTLKKSVSTRVENK